MKQRKGRISNLYFNACLICIVLVWSTLGVNAATLYFNGGFKSCKNLKYYAQGNTNYAETAVSQWNGITSNVKIKKTTSKDNAQIIVVCNQFTDTSSGNLGRAVFYRFGETVGNDQIWDQVVCIQYKCNCLNTFTKRIATATHEVGHALSLKDNNNYGPAKRPVMSQGIKTSYDVTTLDKKYLKQKWGD